MVNKLFKFSWNFQCFSDAKATDVYKKCYNDDRFNPPTVLRISYTPSVIVAGLHLEGTHTQKLNYHPPGHLDPTDNTRVKLVKCQCLKVLCPRKKRKKQRNTSSYDINAFLLSLFVASPSFSLQTMPHSQHGRKA